VALALVMVLALVSPLAAVSEEAPSLGAAGGPAASAAGGPGSVGPAESESGLRPPGEAGVEGRSAAWRGGLLILYDVDLILAVP